MAKKNEANVGVATKAAEAVATGVVATGMVVDKGMSWTANDLRKSFAESKVKRGGVAAGLIGLGVAIGALA